MKKIALLGSAAAMAVCSLGLGAGTAGASTTAEPACAHTTIVRATATTLASVKIANKCTFTLLSVRAHIFIGSTVDTYSPPANVGPGGSITRTFNPPTPVARGVLVCGEWKNTSGQILGRECPTM